MLGGGTGTNDFNPTLNECRQLIEIEGSYEFLDRGANMKYARLGHSACSLSDDGIVVTGTKIFDAGTCEYFNVNSN